MNMESIFINGLIGTIYDNDGNVKERGVELIDVIRQVESAKLADGYNVYINSQGGIFETGFEIYEYLEALKKQGKIINTVGVGMVASIATVPYMAGQVRTLKANTEFLIHLPMMMLEGSLNTSDLDYVKSQLEPIEKKLINFYKDKTGLSEEAIAPLVRKETILTPEEAFDLKFSTEIDLEQIKAVAYLKKDNTKLDNQMAITKEDKGWLEQLFNTALSKVGLKPNDKKGFNVVALKKEKQIVNVDLTDANGAIITFPDVADGQTPVVGDMATIDGQPAQGEYLMPDGTTFIFEAGALTQIVEAEMVDNTDAEALADENEKLKAEIEQLKSTFTNEIVNLKKQFTSRFENEPTPTPVPTPTPNQKRNLLKTA